jgi:hypothetical protein
MAPAEQVVATTARTSGRGRMLAAALVAAGLALFFAANAHFLYVAVKSQPDCVVHSKVPGFGATGAYRAATSAC